MNKALLYQPRQKAHVWIALLASVLLHAAAVAIAQMDCETLPAVYSGPFDYPPVEGDDPPAPDSSPTEIQPIETPPSLPPDNESIRDELSTPTPPPRQVRKNVLPLVHATIPHGGAPNSSSARVLALIAPRPEYPYEARRQRLTGSGVAVMTIDSRTGAVLDVAMEKSTANIMLDQATLASLRRWRFKTGSPAVVRCPITFTLTGATF